MLVEFALASLVLVVIPGPDQALITRNALVFGRAAGVRTMLGGVSGLTVHAGAAALGISALLAQSATAFATLKVLGVVYLLFLGARMLVTAQPGADPSVAVDHGRGTPFVHGLLSNALNPKVALFFVTFLPQFLPEHAATLGPALGLSMLFAAVYLAWFSVLIGLIGVVGQRLRRPRMQAWLERATGITLVVFGLRLASQRT